MAYNIVVVVVVAVAVAVAVAVVVAAVVVVVVAPLSSIRPSPQVVIGDLGCVEVASPQVRLVKKLRSSEDDIGVCTPNYRPPDVYLGNQRFQEYLDMWSFGCTAVELWTRQPLFVVAGEPAPGPARPAAHPKAFVDRIREILGIPGLEPGSRRCRPPEDPAT